MEYKNNNGLNLCDYVTLNILDATNGNTPDTVPTGGIYEWIIPTGAYYSNRRGQVCTVEISSGAIASDTSNVDEVIGVYYENGGFNHHATGNNRPLIGISTYLDKYVKGTGQLLCDARPQQIRLKIVRPDRATAGSPDRREAVTGNLIGSITLKFQYYNSIQSTEQLHSEYASV